MEKKKSTKFKVLFFIFLAVFVVGVIGMIIPFDFESYSYSVDNVSAINVYPDTHRVSFDIKLLNSGSTGPAVLQVSFRYRFEGETENVTVHSDIVSLKPGLNTISITYKDDDWGPVSFRDVDYLRIQFASGEDFAIYQNPFFAGPNFTFFALTVIGFIVSAVSFILWKNSGKIFVNPVEESFGTSIGTTISNTMRTFEERIKEAFKPTNEETSSKPKEKLTCSYCKCKFDGEKNDKCPHCGAPPEHKD